MSTNSSQLNKTIHKNKKVYNEQLAMGNEQQQQQQQQGDPIPQ